MVNHVEMTSLTQMGRLINHGSVKKPCKRGKEPVGTLGEFQMKRRTPYGRKCLSIGGSWKFKEIGQS